MLFLLKAILLAILVLIFLGFLRTFQLLHSKEQRLFLKGRIPFAPPDGFLKGYVKGPKVPWLGKRFDFKTHSGINIFHYGFGSQKEQYPFKTSLGPSLCDGAIEVIRVDYDVAQNWFWIRLILDEIVEIETGHFLGKLQFRLIPGIPFTLAFFELQR